MVYTRLTRSSSKRIQHGVVAALVFAAEDQVNAAGERFERLDGGIDVRGLGVVVVLRRRGWSRRIPGDVRRP